MFVFGASMALELSAHRFDGDAIAVRRVLAHTPASCASSDEQWRLLVHPCDVFSAVGGTRGCAGLPAARRLVCLPSDRAASLSLVVPTHEPDAL